MSGPKITIELPLEQAIQLIELINGLDNFYTSLHTLMEETVSEICDSKVEMATRIEVLKKCGTSKTADRIKDEWISSPADFLPESVFRKLNPESITLILDDISGGQHFSNPFLSNFITLSRKGLLKIGNVKNHALTDLIKGAIEKKMFDDLPVSLKAGKAAVKSEYPSSIDGTHPMKKISLIEDSGVFYHTEVITVFETYPQLSGGSEEMIHHMCYVVNKSYAKMGRFRNEILLARESKLINTMFPTDTRIKCYRLVRGISPIHDKCLTTFVEPLYEKQKFGKSHVKEMGTGMMNVIRCVLFFEVCCLLLAANQPYDVVFKDDIDKKIGEIIKSVKKDSEREHDTVKRILDHYYGLLATDAKII